MQVTAAAHRRVSQVTRHHQTAVCEPCQVPCTCGLVWGCGGHQSTPLFPLATSPCFRPEDSAPALSSLTCFAVPRLPAHLPFPPPRSSPLPPPSSGGSRARACGPRSRRWPTLTARLCTPTSWWWWVSAKEQGLLAGRGGRGFMACCCGSCCGAWNGKVGEAQAAEAAAGCSRRAWSVVTLLGQKRLQACNLCLSLLALASPACHCSPLLCSASPCTCPTALLPPSLLPLPCFPTPPAPLCFPALPQCLNCLTPLASLPLPCTPPTARRLVCHLVPWL